MYLLLDLLHAEAERWVLKCEGHPFICTVHRRGREEKGHPIVLTTLFFKDSGGGLPTLLLLKKGQRHD
jgi:hypothetical protein